MTRPTKNKAVPQSETYWMREYRGIWKMIDDMPDMADDMGRMWCDSMIRYYRRRLRHMYQFRPGTIRLACLRKVPEE